MRNSWILLSIAVITALHANGAAGASVGFAADSNGLVNVAALVDAEFYDVLTYGGRVYVAEVQGLDLDPSSDRAIWRGSIRLKVTQTLFGQAVHDLILPWSSSNTDVSVPGHHLDIWPPRASLVPGTNLLLIVVPGAYDPQASIIPGANSAASYVHIVEPKTLPQSIGWMRRICDLQRRVVDADQTETLEAFGKATTDPDGRVRFYSLNAMADKYIKVDAKKTLNLLESSLKGLHASRADDQAFSERVFQILRACAMDPERPVDVRQTAVASISDVFADAVDPVVQLGGLKQLASVVTSKAEVPTTPASQTSADNRLESSKASLTFKSVQLLGPEQIARMNASLDKISSRPEAAPMVRTVRRWLTVEK